MKRFLMILAYMCLAILLIGMPYGMFRAMGESGYLDTGSPSSVLLANIPSVLPPSPQNTISGTATEPKIIGGELRVTVIASTLEKREKAGGGGNKGYWLAGDKILVALACGSQSGDVWIAFAGGWSAAKYQGREFVSPLPVVTEVCDE